MFRRALFSFSLIVFSLAVSGAQAATPVKIAASFSLLADMVQEVGGPDVEVVALVGPNGDAHTYQPTPQDMKKLAGAEIIAINGLKFEGWLGKLIAASGTKAKLLVASAGVTPRLMADDEDRDASSHRKAGEIVPDPHAWQSLKNAQIYVRNIEAALIAARPECKDGFVARARAYKEKLVALDKDLTASFAAIPAPRRKVITTHDAFGYFGQDYKITFLSPVGLSTEAEPSASAVAALVRQMRAEGLKTVFLENMAASRLIQSLAKEAGAAPGGTLYPDALSPKDGPAPTYLALMRHNADLMLASMR